MAAVLPALQAHLGATLNPAEPCSKLLPLTCAGFQPVQLLSGGSRAISEVVIGEKLLMALDVSGVCRVFNRDSGLLLVQLASPLRRIRTLFLNRTQDSLVIVYTQEDEQLSRLHCESYPCCHLGQGSLQSTELFTEENLSHPGFIEFDEVNGKVITRSGSNGVFKLWSLQDYSLCYLLDHDRTEELRVTRSLLLLIMTPQDSHLPLKLLNIETGRLLNAYVLDIIEDEVIEMVELFQEFLLFKQARASLNILNLLTLTQVKVEQFVTPQAFLFLPQQMLFIAIKDRVMDTWSFQGQRLATISINSPLLVNVPLQHPIKVATCAKQRVAILACSPRTVLGSLDVNRSAVADLLFCDVRSGARVKEVRSATSVPEITTVHYDEETHEIYTGHSTGVVTRWAN